MRHLNVTFLCKATYGTLLIEEQKTWTEYVQLLISDRSKSSNTSNNLLVDTLAVDGQSASISSFSSFYAIFLHRSKSCYVPLIHRSLVTNVFGKSNKDLLSTMYLTAVKI